MEQAQEILIDKEAVRRKTLTDEVIQVAYRLADVALKVKEENPDFKYNPASIGSPYDFWVEKCPEVDSLSTRQFSNACHLAAYICNNI